MRKIDAKKFFRSLENEDKRFLRILTKGVSGEMQIASRKAARMQQEAKQAAAKAVLNC